MREILFRGKRIDNGEWVEGDLRHWISGKVGIHNDVLRFTLPVIPETVGQYTGLKDRNGKQIFEGDIVAIWSDYHNRFVDPSEVMYGFFNCTCCDGVFGWQFDPGDIRRASDYVVIGNIHDNPELLKEGAK